MKILLKLFKKPGLRFILSAILLLFFPASLPQLVYACSPSYPYRPPTLGQSTRSAELVLEASLLEKIPGDPPFFDAATFTVHHWLKGEGPMVVTVQGFGPSPQCLAEIPERRSILFVNGDPLAGPLILNYPGDIVVYPATDETISEIESAIQLQDMIVKGATTGLSVLVAIAVVIVWRRRRQSI
jgi:hypothetical protein